MKYNNLKVMPYEKQIIKGLVAMYVAQGISIGAGEVEHDLMRITGNKNYEHRQVVEDYIVETYGLTVGYRF